MDRGVQEHYWNKEAVYKPYTDGIDGERFFQCLICLRGPLVLRWHCGFSHCGPHCGPHHAASGWVVCQYQTPQVLQVSYILEAFET
jgi:hypothetical protein